MSSKKGIRLFQSYDVVEMQSMIAKRIGKDSILLLVVLDNGHDIFCNSEPMPMTINDQVGAAG